jgi:6-phosphogluconate dehydrogenase
MAAALDARVLSAMKADRERASRSIEARVADAVRGDRDELIAAVRDALLASKICAYAQGMHLIRAASDQYEWGVNLKDIARIWKGGCIIRAKLLDSIMRAYDRSPDLANLFMDDELGGQIGAAQPGWRQAVEAAQALGIPVPAMGASLAYFDSYRTARLPQNLTQAQRDAFGSHTYERADRPEDGFVHTDWLGQEDPETATGRNGEPAPEQDHS